MPVAQGVCSTLLPPGTKARRKITAWSTLHLGVHVKAKRESDRERTVRTDIYTGLFLWNKNVDPLIRVLQRLEALRILPEGTLKECEIRLEEWRERTDHGRLSSQREAVENAGRNDLVQ